MCVAAAIAGAAVVGAGATIYASNQASDAQQNAAGQANNTQMTMFNQTAGRLAPYNATGQAATGALASYYGLPGAAKFNPSTLTNLPGYQFQQQQGNLATQRDLAAQGLLNSGAAGKALQTFGQGLASSYGQQYASGLAGLAGQGENAAAGTGYLGQQTANQIGANTIYGGNAAASGYANTANAVNGGLQGLVSAYGYQNGYGGQGYVAPNAGFNNLNGLGANPTQTGGGYTQYYPDMPP